jgi:uncharacterized protein
MSYIEDVRNDADKRRMLEFVERRLRDVDSLTKSGKNFVFRSRFGHTKRVLEWALRINEGIGADPEIITVAAIFHDVGYSVSGEGHAGHSERIFRKYMEDEFAAINTGGTAIAHSDAIINTGGTAIAHNDAIINTRIGEIAAAISLHSDKSLDSSLLTAEQMVLMDADLLDEAGAIRVLWECFAEAGNERYDYMSTYQKIKNIPKSLTDDFALMHTDEGRRLHREMQEYVAAFISGLEYELR